jgi:hypothetical protein
MFLSCNLLIALIDVPCKSSHRIVRLKPSVRVCHPDGDDYASEQEQRTARTREGRGQDDEKEWDGSKGVKGAEKRSTLWDETCSTRRRQMSGRAVIDREVGE